MAGRIFVIVLLLLTSRLSAQGWGSLKAQFFYQGVAPKAVAVPASAGMCGKAVLTDGLTIGPKNELANVIVYLRQTKDDKVPVHESLAELAKTPVKLDNAGCYFVPKAFTVLPGQQIVVGNKDSIGHNSKFEMFDNPSINPLIPAGATIEHKFEKPEKSPMPVGCSIHPWMKAHLMINANPYAAVSDPLGMINIEKVPEGTWTFVIWHGANVQNANHNGTEVRWKKGQVTTVIQANKTTNWGRIEFVATPL